jgi:lysine 2,3-aminomutase
MNRDYKSIPLWKDVTAEQWNDWKWQLKNRISSLEQLKQVVDIGYEEEQEIASCLEKYPMAVTPYYVALIDKDDRSCPIRMQVIPSVRELQKTEVDQTDPLHETINSPVPGLIHRYPDRVALLISGNCAVYCRFCTRKSSTYGRDRICEGADLDKAISYLRNNRHIRDVLLTGGDPLCLSDNKLGSLLERLRPIENVEIIRIGSRVPVTMPQRITPELCAVLKKHHPIWLNTHFNHPREITAESQYACEMLASAGIPLGNQSVLLKGINDSPAVMQKLVHGLLKIRVRPYYLYQCDLTEGIGHFRTPVSTGIDIIRKLQGHTSGLAVPTYVIDAPGGGGKIPVNKNYIISHSSQEIILQNFQGQVCKYPEVSRE